MDLTVYTPLTHIPTEQSTNIELLNHLTHNVDIVTGQGRAKKMTDNVYKGFGFVFLFKI